MGKALIVTTAAVAGIAGIVALNYFDPAKVRNTENTTNAPQNAAAVPSAGQQNADAGVASPQAQKNASAENIENAAPVLSDASGRIAISDDGDTLASATVQITGSTASDEALSVNLEGTDLKSAFDSSAKTLTISGIAPLQDYETALQRVAFDAPKSENGERTLQVIVNDGELASDPAFLKAAVQTVGDESGEEDAGTEENSTENKNAESAEPAKSDVPEEAPSDKKVDKKEDESKKSDDEKDTLSTGGKESDVQ